MSGVDETAYLHLPSNVFDVELQEDDDDPAGYHARYARLGPLVGGRALGASVYELDPGEAICPYHYELGNEEWLIVLDGKPSFLDEDHDEFQLEKWDVLLFPEGEKGGHKVVNHSSEPARVMMVSTKNDPSLAFYPDSNKVGAWAAPGQRVGLFRLDDAVDYWEGEAEVPVKASEESGEA